MGGLRVLVTGGAGFVGSHLCDRLLADGHEVICLDNLATGSKRNIAHLSEHPGFRFVEQNVQQPFTGEVDRVYNLACPASPPHYQRDPIDTIETNVVGMKQMLELARRCGARVLQASTSEVYGDPQEHPQRETYWGNVDPTSTRACYDEGKRCAETLCFDYHRVHNVDMVVVRIFNTYGPRMDINDGRVVSNFVTQALRGEDLTVYGDGSFTRSFQYVDDLVEGLVTAMRAVDFTGPVNLGNPGEFTILELADLVLEMTGSESGVIHLPEVAHDPKRRKAEVSFAKSALGWEPTVPLRSGLRQTIDWFRQRLTES
jgi:UDP-glucuronate decarboxylase